MMTYQLGWLRRLVLVGFFLVLSGAALMGQKSQPATGVRSDSPREQVVAAIPSEVDAPLTKDRLLQAFRNGSSLNRVALLEQIDASPAVDTPAAVSILQDSLRDKDALVREAALRALIRRDSEENPVLNESDAASFQGESGELARVHFAAKHEDTAGLKELILSGDAVVQESAFEALAATDLTSAVETLRTELRDKGSLHRLQTLELLARNAYTNSPRELLPLLREVAADQDPLVRDYANRTLKEKTLEAEGNPAP